MRRPDDVSLAELFLLFSQFGLSSFGGGVSAWMHRAFVERRAWLGEAEFFAALALARITPGVNVINLAVLIGQGLRGAPGAMAAALGLIVGPSLAAIGLTMAYDALDELIAFHAALEGAGAAAAGLLVAVGVSSITHIAGGAQRPGHGCASGMSPSLHAGPLRWHSLRGATARFAQRWQSLGAMGVLLTVFVLIGLMRLSTVPVVLCLAPISIALAFFSIDLPGTERSDGRR